MNCSTRDIQTSTVIAGNTSVLLAYVVNADDEPITQADVDSITVSLYDVTDGDRTNIDLDGEELDEGSYADEPEAADVVYDTLITDSRWSVNSTGANVAYKVVVPEPDKTYEIRITINTTAGDPLVFARRLVSK